MLQFSLADRIRLAIAIAHGLQFQEELDGFEAEGMRNVAEAAWYQTVTHCLTVVFKDNPRFTLNPQRPIKRLLYSDSKQKDVVQKRIPDFMVFLSQYKIVYDFPVIIRTAPIMVVEVKASPKVDTPLARDQLRQEAWDQACIQAAYVLAKAKWQKAVGVMVCVGVEWAFVVIGELMVAKLPENTDDEYHPYKESESEDSDIEVKLDDKELQDLIGGSLEKRLGNLPIRPSPQQRRDYPTIPSRVGPVTRSFTLKARAAAASQLSETDLSGAGPPIIPATFGTLTHPQAAERAQGPPDGRFRVAKKKNKRRKKRKDRFFDPSTARYFEFGTNDSRKALFDMRKALEGMPGFQTEEWQEAFTNINSFDDMQRMFDNKDAETEPPAGC